jgi:hypothetical protein
VLCTYLTTTHQQQASRLYMFKLKLLLLQVRPLTPVLRAW